MIEIERPSISVIVPVYNVENYIKQCVDSLINQTLPNIEIILVDDGATDKSPIICDDYASKHHNIKVIHKENGGLSSARNAGIKEAQGKYIGFVDSDDYVSEKMYETLWNLAEANGADCAYCEFIRFWNDKITIPASTEKNIKIYSGEEILDQYLLDRVGCNPSEKRDCSYGASVWLGLFKSNVLQMNNIDFVSEREFIAEDMIFDLDFIPCCKKIVHTNESLYFYRFNPDSLTTRYMPNRFERNVALCDGMELRLSRIYDFDVYKIRLDRYFLKITRIALIEEMIHIEKNGWKTVRTNMSRIAHNKELKQILSTYPINSFPITQKVFFWALKHKIYLLLAILIKCNMILKRNG